MPFLKCPVVFMYMNFVSEISTIVKYWISVFVS